MKGVIIAALLATAVAAPACAGPFEQSQIRTTLKYMTKAFHDHDLNGVMMMYDPQGAFTAYDLVPPLRYVGYAAYRENTAKFMSQFKGPIAVEFKDFNVVADNKMGYVFTLQHISGALTNGQKVSMWMRMTSIFRRYGNQWKDVHDHISVPVDLDSGKAMTDLTP